MVLEKEYGKYLGSDLKPDPELFESRIRIRYKTFRIHKTGLKKLNSLFYQY
jgi:hypothetical protein